MRQHPSAHFLCREAYRLLSRLHSSPELAPGHPAFGLTAFCLRSLLDDLGERVDLALAVGERRGAAAGPPFHADLSTLPASDGALETRYLQLCCPLLEHARHLFAGGRRTSPRRSDKGIRVMRPSATAASTQSLGDTAVGAALAAGGSVGADEGGGGGRAAAPAAGELEAAAAEKQAVKLKLQRAFLEQYSTEDNKVGRVGCLISGWRLQGEHGGVSLSIEAGRHPILSRCSSHTQPCPPSQVKLKEVVDYVADVLAVNAAAEVAEIALGPALAPLVRQLDEAAAAYVASAPEHVDVAQDAAMPDLAMAAAGAKRVFEAIVVQGEGQAASEAHKVAHERAMAAIKANAVHAVLALTPASLGDAVRGTAAGIIAEVAGAACERQLAGAVPRAVKQRVGEEVERVVREVKRSIKGLRGGASVPINRTNV